MGISLKRIISLLTVFSVIDTKSWLSGKQEGAITVAVAMAVAIVIVIRPRPFTRLFDSIFSKTSSSSGSISSYTDIISTASLCDLGERKRATATRIAYMRLRIAVM